MEAFRNESLSIQKLKNNLVTNPWTASKLTIEGVPASLRTEILFLSTDISGIYRVSTRCLTNNRSTEISVISRLCR